MSISLAIVADFDPNSRSHIATNDAIAHSSASLGLSIRPSWIATDEVIPAAERLAKFTGIWVGPCSPYRSMEGALAAIRFAREKKIPLLGTCGGFQHTIIEYARNVLGFESAEHEETSPLASPLFISRLACSLVGRSKTLQLHEGSRLAAIYGSPSAEEQYLCNFGVNPQVVDTFRKVPLKIAASDDEGEIRAVELSSHPFFIATLFLPQHRSTTSKPHPLVTSFLKASNRGS